MNSLLILILAMAAAKFHMAAAFEMKDCAANKDPSAKMLSLNIDTCPGALGKYCNFIKGKDATLTLDVLPTRVFSQANIKLKAKIGSIFVPFKLPGSSDACRAYGFTCPTKVGEKQQMVVSLPVLRIYPSIKTTVRAELIDENKKPIVCVEFPVQIKSK